MTKKDFFILLIKSIGLYSLLLGLVQNIPFIFSVQDLSWSYLTLQIGLLLAYLGIIMSAARIASFLRLNNDIETEFISFKYINGTTLFQLGIIIVGAYLFVQNIAEVLINFMYFLADKAENKIVSGNIDEFYTTHNFLQALIISVLALLLLTRSAWLAKLLHKDQG